MLFFVVLPLFGSVSALYRTTFVITEEFKKPDCVDRAVVAVNGQVPGPVVRVKPSELLEITVWNKLTSRSVSVHWHGQKQIGTPWQDGSSMHSGCPIPPKTKWVYRFRANDKPGTYFYHGHTGGISTSGLTGAFIIEGDVSDHAVLATGEHTMMLMDWWHAPEEEMIAGFNAIPFRWSGDPQSILINGKGFFPCAVNEVYNCSEPSQCNFAPASLRPYYRPSYIPAACDDSSCRTLELFHGVKGKTYLIRLIAAGALSLYNVAIENHTLTVVEVDGEPTQPFVTGSVDLNAGQRVGVLVTLDQTVGDYAIRVMTRARPAVRTAHAILRYADPLTGAVDATADSFDPAGRSISQPLWSDHNFTFNFQNSIKGLYSGAYALPQVPSNDVVTRRFTFLTTMEWMPVGTSYNAEPSITSVQQARGVGSDRPENFCTQDANNKMRWPIGRRDFMLPSTPALGALYFNLSSVSLGEENGYYELEVGKVYDIVIQHHVQCYGSCDGHSWHLHGAHF